ncbi:MAG TPA: hypothetical protein PL182_07465 [Pseudobdellovibrionaceae bacterium]|nr:hypothetical protein [Pseudobdellovibrionaceae bacterium]
MTEFLFVLKCLAVTALFTMAMQLQMNGVPVERKIESMLEASPAVAWVQSAAAGGALMIQRSAGYVNSKAKELVSGEENSASYTQRAGR